jgi:hypothetical protein
MADIGSIRFAKAILYIMFTPDPNFSIVVAPGCGTNERMSMEKKTCLIPDDGEYRLKRSRHLGRNYKSTDSDFSSGSRAKRATRVSMRWHTCKAK